MASAVQLYHTAKLLLLTSEKHGTSHMYGAYHPKGARVSHHASNILRIAEYYASIAVLVQSVFPVFYGMCQK